MNSTHSKIQEPQSATTSQTSIGQSLIDRFSAFTRTSKNSKPSYYEARKRAIRIIESCRTMEQLEVAERYAELSGLKGDGVTEAHCMNKYYNLNEQ